MESSEFLDIELNPSQFDALSGLSDDLWDMVVVIGGRGAGKSIALGLFSYEMASLPGSVNLLTAPVVDTLNNSTLPGVLEAWAMIGLVEGRDYVFGAAPKKWKVTTYQKLRNVKIVTWRWGSYTLLDGSDNYAKHRGIELDSVAIDEFGELKAGALDVYIGGLRGKATKRAGKTQKVFAVGNPPSDPYQVQRWEGVDGARVFEVPSHENRRNLPAGYIERMKRRYDRLTYKREVLGKVVATGGMRAFYAFKPEQYPAGNLLRLAFDPHVDLTLTCDFNASESRPMSWFICQRRLVEARWLDVVVQEFINPGTHTDTQTEIVCDWLAARGFKGTIRIRGDATGGDKARNSTTARSDYQTMKTILRAAGPWKVEDEKVRRTRRVKDRIAATNSRWRSADKKIHLVINPDTCPQGITAFKQLRWKENGMELEDVAFKDPVDALSYFPYTEYPIHINETTVKQT
ncbi:MAG: hypothetical protein ABIR47_07470 [Candidatus Kapaibacterium sp.]